MSEPAELTGQRFGRLVVMGRYGRRGKTVYWRCKCDCGNKTKVRTQNLREGTKSCGCYQRELARIRIKIMHKNRRKWYSQEYIAELIYNANEIAKRMLKDVKNKDTITVAKGYQTFQNTPQKLIFFTESDTTAVTFIEPKRKIIWNTQITGIPNL